jgi:hypothetical protein
MKSYIIKKMSLMLLAAALGFAPCSCGEKGGGDEGVKEIELKTPDNNALFDLSNTENITFSWTQIEGVTSYTLKFAPNETALANTRVTINAGNTNSYVLSAQAADVMLAENTPLKPGESTDMYWTVTSTASEPEIKTQVRKFNVKRLPVAVSPNLEISTESLVFQANSTAVQTVSVTSNTVWNVTISQTGNWLSVNSATGSGDGILEFTAEVNTGEARTATVSVSASMVETKTVSVSQASAGGATSEELAGVWNLKIAEMFGTVRGISLHVVTKRNSAFTLNTNGTFTGDIYDLASESSNDGSDTKTWNYANGQFSFNQSGDNKTYKATLAATELMFEYGVAGENNYAKAIYTRENVTVPPLPTEIATYSGDPSIFHGVWAVSKSENNYANPDGSNPVWYEVNYNVSDEAMKLTVNSNGTFTMVNKIEEMTLSGTWSFANGSLTINSTDEGTETAKIEAGSNASTLIWSNIYADDVEKGYSRTTLTKIN